MYSNDSQYNAQKAVVNGRNMEVTKAARNCKHLKAQEYS
jgi:hypothetical protein